ncbi:hypothetical protein IMG5_190250 [Ichthyophthirius multifiliis]|uniref:Glutaredoxin domain-containing protein n=1 Tax=Ichthyophthirius multifiliis TaxID=5932 RepID=G0R483_ICHMU|nr:hypothetical protein IMG5_190250 [Ichthyophthirius multifiliis]EGR27730.1 hypothetical protein IMG5_190250 [Ichthyophthirius multifiliis]|eukprot:XP_004025182.1 hypothetical protein IMG5_190250 [Ichthyophthirius multifiliis]
MQNSIKRVKIYGAEWCPYCVSAKKLFTNLEIDFDYIDVDQHQNEKDQIQKQYNWDTVPMIFIDGKFEGGFSDVSAKLRSGKINFDI